MKRMEGLVPVAPRGPIKQRNSPTRSEPGSKHYHGNRLTQIKKRIKGRS